MSLLANSNAIESGGYPIQRSLRFRSSASAYLNRTFTTPTSSTIFTWSGWVKRGTLGATGYLFGASTTTNFGFNSSNQLLLTLNGTAAVTTTAVYRDPSSWYHVLYNQNGSAQTVYVNNVSVGTGTTANTVFNTAIAHQIAAANTTNYFDGYLAEVNFIDGQALTPSSFGQTDAVTGVWQPLKYMGTYGTNGFYLPFSDNTSATTLAYDKSGNGNNWTANNISTTAGATYDSMTDVPTLTSPTAANYCVLNSLTIRGASGTLSNANLSVAASSASSPADTSMYATMGLPSNGLIYLEALYTVTAGTGNDTRIGVSTVGDTGSYVQAGSTTNYWSYDYKNGTANAQGTNTSYTAATTGQIVMWAIDVANGKIWAGANGTWFNSGNPAAGTGAVLTGISTFATNLHTTLNGWVNRCSLDFNFGQRPFSYTPPTGFVALNTYNLPTPTILAGNKYMDATLYSGTSASQSVTNAGAFQPDLVWIKSRSAATDHKLTDSVRGVTKALISDTTGAETTDTNGLTAFNSNGFTVGSDSVYNNGTGPATYVGWQWKESATAGFDIVTYTGTGTNTTVAHSLGVAPSMMIVKSRSQGTTGYTGNWAVWHSAIANTEYLLLNTTAAKATGATYWNSTTPTSSVFSLGTAAVVNNNNDNFVNYLFAEIAGFSKFGSYTGNGSADGPFVYTGFRPAYVMTKCSSTTGDWRIYDLSRPGYNVIGGTLLADTSGAETTTAEIDLLSNGFKLRIATDPNSAQTFVYAAFSQNPFKYSNAR